MKRTLTSLLLLSSSHLAVAAPDTQDATKSKGANKAQAIIDEMPKFSDEPDGIGVGFGVGEPMGVAVAYRPTHLHTFAAMTGWSFSDSTLHVHADYLLTITTIEPSESAISLGVYGGVGPTLNLGRGGEQAGFGVRVPVGISVAFKTPVDIFLELAPVIGAIPEMQLYANGTLGVRAWFRPKR